ncbi:MAG: hypothetical protein GEV28_11130 [Actinophytocola sp.]|uniref:hypothetical protein n=1 Tax=Actinophytocola sp. TaxID=1872138 RepID=UPI00132BB0EA|nr:hypothetical protein [Actinophytocola sp.]MPZ80909.1 hypothetical protein [Actinophytocola sp.]
MHAVLIALHALTGTVALLAGCVAHRRRAYFEVYLWSLVATVAFLAAAVAEEWSRLDAVSRALFAAFVVLGLVMLWLACTARRLPAPSPRYVDRVGFTLVALFDAFIVITVLNLGAPVALVVASGVVVAVAGHFALRAAKAETLVPR